MSKHTRVLAHTLLILCGYMAWGQQMPNNVIDGSVLFTELHANAPVGGCGCFWLTGGTGEISIPVWRRFSAVADVSGESAGNIPGSNVGLSLLNFFGGLRLRFPTKTLFQPFAQGLVGGVHGFDSYFPASVGHLPSSSSTAFALAVGGGVDLAISKHIWIRAIQAEYHYSQLPNLQGDRQNQVRLSAGIVFRKPGN